MEHFIQTFLQHSELFGKKLTNYEIKKIIEKWNGYPVAVLLSMLTFHDMDNHYLKEIFLKKLIGNDSEKVQIVEKRVIATAQGLLTLWKLLLTHNEICSDNIENLNMEEGIFSLLLLTTAVQDHLNPNDYYKHRLKYYFQRNIYFNTSDNIYNTIARTWMIYFEEEIIQDLKQTNEYVDYPKAFSDKYGYTIETYLAVLMAIFSFYESKDNKEEFDKPWILNPDEYFKDTLILEVVKDIISSLSFTWSEGKSWAKNKLKYIWDFSLFYEKPLLQIVDGKYIPVSKKFLELQLFDSLFFKIRNCFPGLDLSFNSYFGRPFEVYSQWIMENAIKDCKLEYNYIKEFPYGKISKKSPDIILKLDNDVLIIEVKSKRPKTNGFIYDNDESIEESFNEIVVNPLNQAIDRTKDIIRSKACEALTIDNNYYFMTVSLTTMPTIAEYIDMLNLPKEDTEIKIAGVYYLDIEEFEYLCEVTSANPSESIFDILDKKQQEQFKYNCFKNFLIASSYIPIKQKILIERANKLFELALNLLKK